MMWLCKQQTVHTQYVLRKKPPISSFSTSWRRRLTFLLLAAIRTTFWYHIFQSSEKKSRQTSPQKKFFFQHCLNSISSSSSCWGAKKRTQFWSSNFFSRLFGWRPKSEAKRLLLIQPRFFFSNTTMKTSSKKHLQCSQYKKSFKKVNQVNKNLDTKR